MRSCPQSSICVEVRPHAEDSLQTLQVKQASWNKCPIARQALPAPYTPSSHLLHLPEEMYNTKVMSHQKPCFKPAQRRTLCFLMLLIFFLPKNRLSLGSISSSVCPSLAPLNPTEWLSGVLVSHADSCKGSCCLGLWVQQVFRPPDSSRAEWVADRSAGELN